MTLVDSLTTYDSRGETKHSVTPDLKNEARNPETKTQ